MGNPYWDDEEWDNAASISGRSYDRQVYGGRADRPDIEQPYALSGAGERRYYNRKVGGRRYWQQGDKRPRQGETGTGWSRAAYGEEVYDPSDRPRESTRRDTGPWSNAGEMTGRGPRNYQRSDERIMEDVCDRLTRHGWIDASNIEVRVENGEVTLEGAAPDRRTKRLAEDAAESVSGVKDVHNYLRLQTQVRQETSEPAGTAE